MAVGDYDHFISGGRKEPHNCWFISRVAHTELHRVRALRDGMTVSDLQFLERADSLSRSYRSQVYHHYRYMKNLPIEGTPLFAHGLK